MLYGPDKKRRGVLGEYLQGYSFHRAPKTLQEAVKTFTGYLREAPKTVHCGSSHTSPEQLPEGRLRESFPTEPQMSLPSWGSGRSWQDYRRSHTAFCSLRVAPLSVFSGRHFEHLQGRLEAPSGPLKASWRLPVTPLRASLGHLEASLGPVLHYF